MCSPPSLRRLALLVPLLGGLLFGLLADVPVVSAEPLSGATSGPWRCRSFDLTQGIEGSIADWLYQYAATGPDNVLVLSGSDSSRSYVTICAWDSGFAAAHWLAQEEERRRHEQEVEARKKQMRKSASDEGRLFSEEAVEFEDAGEKKKQGRKR